jgi:hypothetical protein
MDEVMEKASEALEMLKDAQEKILKAGESRLFGDEVVVEDYEQKAVELLRQAYDVLMQTSELINKIYLVYVTKTEVKI